MFIPPVRLDPPRSSLLSVADPLPDPPADSLAWWDGGITMPIRPAGHGTIGGTPDFHVQPMASQSFGPFPLDYALKVQSQYALGPDTINELERFAADGGKADAAYLMSRALQLGTTYCGITNPGLATVPDAVLLTLEGVEEAVEDTAPTGTAMTITAAVGALLEWWRTAGLPGMAIIHLPAVLFPAAAAARLIEPGQQGPALLAGGTAWLSFGPGYDPAVGPQGSVAGDGTAFVWITSRVYAGTRDAEDAKGTSWREGNVAVVDADIGLVAFNTSTVAAAYVETV